jgi:predicted AAA+ superfamily ATPase
MRAASLRVGQLVNQTELGRDVALAQPTVHRYLNLLETSYQLVRVPAYAVNRTKRLIKTPKLYWSDTGLAQHLSGVSSPGGASLENLVLMDLLSWREGRKHPAEVLYWRTATGEEVDFVLEVDDEVIPIEVKATTRPRNADTKGLRAFREEYADRARPGLLLHVGETIERLAPNIIAAPWWRVI